MLCAQDNAGGAKQELGNAVSNLDSLKAVLASASVTGRVIE